MSPSSAISPISPEEVQYLTMPRNPYPVDVPESGAERTRDATAYQMGVRETEQFARTNETAADFGLITPFPGFDLAWGSVVFALILDRRVHFFPTPRPPGGVRILLASGDERTSCTPQCDFGAQQTGIFVIAGMVDLDIHSEDTNHCSLLVNNCIMKLARLLDPALGGNLQLMNAFIHSDKSMHISILYFSGEPQDLKVDPSISRVHSAEPLSLDQRHQKILQPYRWRSFKARYDLYGQFP